VAAHTCHRRLVDSHFLRLTSNGFSRGRTAGNQRRTAFRRLHGLAGDNFNRHSLMH
jgi:hypothetical protein